MLRGEVVYGKLVTIQKAFLQAIQDFTVWKYTNNYT